MLLHIIIGGIASAKCAAVIWPVCWMVVNLRKSRSYDHTADLLKDSPPEQRPSLANAVAKLASSFYPDDPRPSPGRKILRRSNTRG